jgi:hypothetical protein
MDLGGATASLEMWVYPTTSNAALLTKGGGVASYSTTNGIEYTFAFASSVFTFYSNNGGSFQTLTDSIARPLNTWYHLVVATNATIQSLYVNGTRTATITAGIAKPTTRTGVRFGLDWGSSYYSGYMSNVRFVQGAGAYDASQTTLTVPTSPVTAITNTSLLLNMTNAAIYDAAAQNDLTTVGDAKTDTTTKQWPLSSVKFDGTGDWLLMPNNPAFAFGTGDFTIECWVYFTSVSGAPTITDSRSSTSSTAGFNLGLSSARVQLYTTSQLLIGATTLVINQWYYIAVTRVGTALKIFVNGSQDATTSNSTNFSDQTLVIGATPNLVNPMTGYIQDLRLTKGVGRTITANPTAPFPTR